MSEWPRAAVGAVLFDLDGTFADTAPDMCAALNVVRQSRLLPPVPLAAARPFVSSGARGMVHAGFGLAPDHADYPPLRDAFLAAYAAKLCAASTWFAGMAELVGELERRGLPWGIVTNKSSRYTVPLAAALGITPRTGCLVSGDTCARAKPHPDPLLHAAALLDVAPSECIYVGDDERDILAANAAGMRGVVAMYGYLGAGAPPRQWPAAAWIDAPMDLLRLLDPA